jgi:hypothetical protein
MSADALFAAIDAHFLAPDALRRAGLFARHGWGVAEGWYKGEMMLLLDALARDGTIEGWRADVPVTDDKRQRCDFRIAAGGSALWLEVKTLVQPAQAATELGGLGKAAGFADDLVKLMRVREGQKGVLLFIVPRPEPAQWADLLALYSRRIAPLGFEELTSVADYPEPLYVCKLALKEAF